MNNKKATSVHIRSIFYDCSSEGMQDDTLLQAKRLFLDNILFCQSLSTVKPLNTRKVFNHI